MSRLTLGLLVIVAAMSCARSTPPATESSAPSAQSTPPSQAPAPNKQAAPAKGVKVEIAVGDFKTHDAACKTGKDVSPTKVFVSGTDVHHCVSGALLNHKDEMAKPDAFKQTLVQLGAGDSITWTSNVAFRVVQVRKHEPIVARGAAYPFTDDLPTEFRTSVTLGPVLDLDGTVVQQYKVSFEIEGIGRVDPDLVCSM